MIKDFEHRITSSHRRREAIVYIRQSTAEQVNAHVGSAHMQRSLREKAIELGWLKPRIIEDDLGISASGYAERPGFQAMMTMVSLRKVGIIFSIDASRLSRNSKDWAQLFEICSFFDTLIADGEQIYNLSEANDKMIMGIKGTISELELSIIKNRLQNGTKAKAERGELRIKLPAGYVYDADNRIDFDPDKRVYEAVKMMFEQFDKFGSIRKTAMWYQETGTTFPAKNPRNNAAVIWRIPTMSTFKNLLIHPIYAGAYVYGRRPTRVEYKDGKLVKKLGAVRTAEECPVCLKDHHPAYISWEKLLANQAKIADNRPRWSMKQNKGAVRDGLALLSGLLRCGACGKKIRVSYKKKSAMYFCRGRKLPSSKRCISLGSKEIDRKVGIELCGAIQPLSIESALAAVEQSREEESRLIENAELQVQAAQYEVDRAYEQYDLVDPKNRLVAAALEEKFNERLHLLNQAREKLEKLKKASRKLSETQKQRLFDLADNFQAVWDSPNVDTTFKKRLLRTAVHEIIVKHQPEHRRVEAIIHWQGGIHTKIYVAKRTVSIGSKADPELVELVRRLADDGIHDSEIARILNMKKIKTPKDIEWTKGRVKNFRNRRRIRLKKKPSEQQFLTQRQAAEYLGVSKHVITGLERLGAVSKNQVTDFAPWRVPLSELNSPETRRIIEYSKKYGRLPKGTSSENQPELFTNFAS